MAYILENQILKVTIAEQGAELISVYDKENAAERMWDANPNVWNRHAPILFPFVGKVTNGIYRYKNQEYQMKIQHGFARDLPFICESSTQQSVTYSLTSNPATKEIYPFDFKLFVTHSLDPENERILKIQWQIKNTGTESMYYSIGGHPGFRTPFQAGEAREDYYLEFPGKKTLHYLLLNPATGFVIPNSTYHLELENGFCPIEKTMFDRDALIFENTQVETVRIAKPNKSPYITLTCKGFPYVGIWSKPAGEFICLEPWFGRTDNDGFSGTLEEKPGIQLLEKAETKQIEYQIEFHQ